MSLISGGPALPKCDIFAESGRERPEIRIFELGLKWELAAEDCGAWIFLRGCRMRTYKKEKIKINKKNKKK